MSAERKQVSGVVASDNSERMMALVDKMDLLGVYLEGIRIPLLTAEEEKEFARRIKKGAKAKKLLDQGSENGRKSELLAMIEDGEAAREHFTEANLPLVVWAAKKYRDKGLSFLDLIQEGNVGLVKAVDRFDPNRDNRFATYAVYWIKKDVKKALSDKSRIIRRPRHINDQMPDFCETTRQLEQRLGRKPTVEEIAAATKLSLSRVKRMTSLPRNPMSLQETLRPGGDTEIIEFIEDESAEIATESAEREVLREKIEELLLLLRVREAKIIRLWLKGYLLREIGDKLGGISRERVRQLRNQALRRLRAFPGTEELRVFL